MAVSSEGEVFSSAELKAVRHRNRRLRAKLQAKGTKAARRLLKHRSKKEQRYARRQNHVVSQKIASAAQRTGRGIALEDLGGIRNRVRLRFTPLEFTQGDAFSAWSFHQLGGFIAYKAQARGVPVVRVDRNTSRTCPACGHVAQSNRKSQSLFLCVSCGCTGNADHFAAVEIGRRAEATSKAANVSDTQGIG